MVYKTEQENFWAGEFGDDYIERNNNSSLLASNLAFFSKSLKSAGDVNSVIEFGSNIGMNLRALKLLFPEQKQFGIELNHKAASKLKGFLSDEAVFEGSIFEYPVQEKFDVSLIKGVLIHINPDMLPLVYEKLYNSSKKYILICEYFNPSPVTISYRGHKDKLYKRDFCGDMLEMYPSLRLLDYGFAYKRDPAFSQDDITWFLLEKV